MISLQLQRLGLVMEPELGGLKNNEALKSYQMAHFQPFNPVHKRTEVT